MNKKENGTFTEPQSCGTQEKYRFLYYERHMPVFIKREEFLCHKNQLSA